MWSPKRLVAPPKQKAQSNRPSRPPFLLTARRAVARGIRTTRQRVEVLQLRGVAVIQNLIETVTTQDLCLAPDILHLADHIPARVTADALGTLLAGGTTPQQQATVKEEPLRGDKAKEVKEEKFLVCEIQVVGADGTLKEIAEEALTIRPNLSYTLTEVNDDLAKIMGTGYFRGCKADPEDTRDGIVLRINVEPNAEVHRIVSTGGNVLPQAVFEKAVRGLLGKTFNNNEFRAAARQLNKWYASEGVLGEVVDAEFDEPNVPLLKISEGIVNRIDLRYFDAKSGEAKEEGSVKPEVIMRHLGTRVGSVVNHRQAQRDVESIFATGLFADVKLIINMTTGSTPDCRKFDFLLNVYENSKTGGLGVGAGWSAQTLTEGNLPGFVGNVEYVEKNMFGLGQRLITRMEFGQVDKLFKLEYNEPWIVGDKSRTSRTFGVMNTRTSGNPFYASADGATGSERFKTVIGRLMGNLTLSRALTEHWSGTVGLTAQRITLMDDNSRAIRQDFSRAPVNVSGDFHDLMLAPFFKAACTGWANSQLMLVAEKAIPVRQDWLSITKCSARAEKMTRLGPLTLVLCGKGGATIGKVPPYEAFALGGINSIRGYREGSVGTACHFVEGTAELRVPLVSNLQGTVFVDCGTDLNTGRGVIGNPGHTRNKPGRGAGVGFGVRVDSPVGPLRLEWAWNDKRSRLFHAGFGDHR